MSDSKVQSTYIHTAGNPVKQLVTEITSLLTVHSADAFATANHVPLPPPLEYDNGMTGLQNDLRAAYQVQSSIPNGPANNDRRNEQRDIVQKLEEQIVSKEKFIDRSKIQYQESQKRGRLYADLSVTITGMLGDLKGRILLAKSTIGYTDTSMHIHEVVTNLKALSKAANKLETVEIVKMAHEIITKYTTKTMYTDFPSHFLAQATEWHKLSAKLVDSEMEAKVTPSDVRQFMLDLIPTATDGSTNCRDECARQVMPEDNAGALDVWIESAHGIVSRYAKSCPERPLTKLAGATTTEKTRKVRDTKDRGESFHASLQALPPAELERMVVISLALPTEAICPLHPKQVKPHSLHGCWGFTNVYCQHTGTVNNPKFMERLKEARTKQGSAWKGYTGN